MTIGDEKVVAWLVEFGDGGIKAVPTNWPNSFQVVRHSAYAELAAELAAVREAYENRTKDYYAQGDAYDASQAKLQAAESQLAELRGKLTALADEWVGEVGTSDQPTPTMQVIHECSNELRTLAAADGG